MNKVNIIIFFCVSVLMSYVVGLKIADAKCRMQIAQESLIKTEQQQKIIVQNNRILHDTVYKTGVADIRRILQSKYTIAE